MTTKREDFLKMATLLLGGALFAIQEGMNEAEALNHAERFFKEADSRGLLPTEEEL